MLPHTGVAAPLSGSKEDPQETEWTHTLQWLPLQKHVPLRVRHPLGYWWGMLQIIDNHSYGTTKILSCKNFKARLNIEN